MDEAARAGSLTDRPLSGTVSGKSKELCTHFGALNRFDPQRSRTAASAQGRIEALSERLEAGRASDER